MSHRSGMSMNGKQRILRFIESFDVIHLRSLDEFAGGIVGPAVILAAHNKGVSLGLLEDGESSVAADVVEAPDIVVLHENEGVAREGERAIGTRLLEVRSVGGIQPGLRGQLWCTESGEPWRRSLSSRVGRDWRMSTSSQGGSCSFPCNHSARRKP